MQAQSRRGKLELLRTQLDNEFSSYKSHLMELGDNIAPRRPRFYTSDVNKGDRRNQKIVDTTPVLAARALSSGMMSGITSPARPWFRLTIADQAMSEAGVVKSWLDQTTDRMNSVFLRSNLYQVLPNLYKELGVFGTAAVLLEEDFDNVIRFYALPVGSYRLGTSEKGRVEIFLREFKMTVRQIIQKFARKETGEINWSVVSSHVKGLYDQAQQEAWVDIVHVITPNDYYDKDRLESKYKKFRSVYYERSGRGNASAPEDDEKYLSEKGYDYFPVLAPRWEVTGEDVYASSCPGMEALGDIKQLQLGQRRIAQAIDLISRPPMKGPTTLRSTSASIIPGKITYTDERGDQGQFKPVFQVDPRIQELEGMQAQIRDRISRTFYEDIFLMLASSDRRQITAREIDERREEKLLALGPVLEQLNQDFLDPLIDFTFDIMLRQGLIEDPPDEIRGENLKVEYISIMAQAQKLAGLASVERFTQFTLQLAAVDPSVLDKMDTAQAIDVYADITSMRAGMVRSDDEVAKIRASRAQAQQAQAQQESMANVSQSAKNLASADLEGDNALTRMMAQSQAGAIA